MLYKSDKVQNFQIQIHGLLLSIHWLFDYGHHFSNLMF